MTDFILSLDSEFVQVVIKLTICLFIGIYSRKLIAVFVIGVAMIALSALLIVMDFISEETFTPIATQK